METINIIEQYFVIGYLLSFMAVTYISRNWINNIFEYLLKRRINKTHAAVFFIGSLVAIPFWFNGDYDRMKLFQTYLLGTAIHSHLIKYLLNYISKKNGDNN